MPNTIREQILDDLKSALDNISTANGYDNDIALVERWDMRGNSMVDLPAIFINTGPETKQDRPSFVTGCDLTVYLDVWTVHDTSAFSGKTDELLSTLAGDVEKAVLADMQRSTLAERTSVVAIDPFENVEGEPYCGVIITLNIKYRHIFGDPKTQT